MPFVSDYIYDDNDGQNHLILDSFTNKCDLLGLSFKLPLILGYGHPPHLLYDRFQRCQQHLF